MPTSGTSSASREATPAGETGRPHDPGHGRRRQRAGPRLRTWENQRVVASCRRSERTEPSNATAAGTSGTTCSRCRFIRQAGIRHSPASSAIFPHVASRASDGRASVVLVYPRTKAFRETLVFRFVDGGDLEMACFPFKVADPAGAVGALMRELTA